MKLFKCFVNLILEANRIVHVCSCNSFYNLILFQPTPAPETVKLPLTISPCEVGQYNCSVVLKAANDIRVYRIECTIKDADSDIEMEFTSPAHQSVSQDIPIVSNFKI